MGKYVDHHLLGISWDIMRQNSKLLVETIKIIHILYKYIYIRVFDTNLQNGLQLKYSLSVHANFDGSD